MLEKLNVQSRGFRNVYTGGKATGFQVRFRTSYYRGLYLSMLRPFEVKVDGETFKGDQIKLTIGGKTYVNTMEVLQKYPNIYWQIYEPVILTINKPGGLALGSHDIECGYAYTQCYEFKEPDAIYDLNFYKRKMTLVR
jgi:hypothetical protein